MKTKTKAPSKQRKRIHKAAYHSRGALLSVHLSLDLRDSHNTRSMPVRTGDKVKILRGDYKGYEGKVQKVDRKKIRLNIEGIHREKSDGTQVPVPIHPSNAEIIQLELGDKRRSRILERRVKSNGEAAAKATKKPAVKAPKVEAVTRGKK